MVPVWLGEEFTAQTCVSRNQDRQGDKQEDCNESLHCSFSLL